MALGVVRFATPPRWFCRRAQSLGGTVAIAEDICEAWGWMGIELADVIAVNKFGNFIFLPTRAADIGGSARKSWNAR